MSLNCTELRILEQKNEQRKPAGGPEAVRLVVFDFDGTLGDTRRNIILTMQETLRRLGLPFVGDEECAATIGLPLPECFRQVVPSCDDALADLCTETYRKVFKENLAVLTPALFPGVRETLAALDARGVRMTVATSRSSASLHHFLRDMQIDGFIGYALGMDDVPACKPAPDAVLKTLQDLGFAPEEALVVGDMPVDIRMGRSAGVRTCGVTYGNGSREALLAAGADFLVDTLPELLALVPFPLD